MIKNKFNTFILRLSALLVALTIAPSIAMGEETKTINCGDGQRTIEISENSIWAGMQECRACGNCSANDFILLGINIFNFVLGIVGALALFVFIYGGLLFLLSGGNSDRIEKGKKALIGAVVGLIIVFTSYMIVNFVAQSLGVSGDTILEAGWFQ
jgi:hypothetical protein